MNKIVLEIALPLGMYYFLSIPKVKGRSSDSWKIARVSLINESGQENDRTRAIAPIGVMGAIRFRANYRLKMCCEGFCQPLSPPPPS